MEIDATPAFTDRELEAVRAALARLEVALSPGPPIGRGAWQVAAAREAVDSGAAVVALRTLAS